MRYVFVLEKKSDDCMRNILFALFVVFLFFSCVTTKTYVVDYGLCKKDVIQSIDASMDKGGLMCYFDRGTPKMPMPNVYLFDKNGKQYNTELCYDMLPRFAERIIKYGKDSLSRSALVSTIGRDDKTKTVWRTNLNRFLKKQHIKLLDGTLFSKEKLPESEYYLFVDYIKEFIPYSMIKLDSICASANEKITLVKVHAYKLN